MSGPEKVPEKQKTHRRWQWVWDSLLIPGGPSISPRYSTDPPGPLPPVGRVGRQQQQQQQVAGETMAHAATAPLRSDLEMVLKRLTVPPSTQISIRPIGGQINQISYDGPDF
jgi:hypothetical protein